MGFADQVRQFTVKTEAQANAVCRKIALDLFTLIVRRWPVDTGRSRANNQIDLNQMSSSSIIEFTKGGAQGQGGAVIAREGAKLKDFELGDTIFIYNNVEYVVYLEFGPTFSPQAPQGMYRISVEDLKTFLLPG